MALLVNVTTSQLAAGFRAYYTTYKYDFAVIKLSNLFESSGKMYLRDINVCVYVCVCSLCCIAGMDLSEVRRTQTGNRVRCSNENWGCQLNKSRTITRNMHNGGCKERRY